MEFFTTKYSYYLPFKSVEGQLEGFTREHIKLNGSFLGKMESPNEATRELLDKINISLENTSNEFMLYVGGEEDFKGLRVDENSKFINTKINFKATEKSLKINGEIYLSRTSFDEVKMLFKLGQSSNAYFKFQTIVYGDKVKNNLPLEIDFHSHTSGIEMIFSK